jgi:hypothetical protein
MNKESDDNTTNTIAGIIHLHMAKLLEMTTATINENATQTDASLQYLAKNTNQLYQQQQDIISQMAMMRMNHGAVAAATQHTIACAPPQIYQTTALPQYQQGYNIPPQQFGG